MLGALGAPAAMALAGLGWTWVLLGGVLAAFLLLAICRAACSSRRMASSISMVLYSFACPA